MINVIIIIYLGWFYINDLTLIHFQYGAELWDIYAYDPVILFYILINVATMIFYYKRNESLSQSVKSSENPQNENESYHPILMNDVVKKFKLTKREEENYTAGIQGAQ